VNVDHHRVGAGGDGSPRHRSDEVPLADRVRWVDDHGQVGLDLGHRHPR